MLSNLLCKHPIRFLVPVAGILSINHHIWQWTAGASSNLKKKTFLLTSTIRTWENWPKSGNPTPPPKKPRNLSNAEPQQETLHFSNRRTDRPHSLTRSRSIYGICFGTTFSLTLRKASLLRKIYGLIFREGYGALPGLSACPSAVSCPKSSSRKALDCPLD